MMTPDLAHVAALRALPLADLARLACESSDAASVHELAARALADAVEYEQAARDRDSRVAASGGLYLVLAHRAGETLSLLLPPAVARARFHELRETWADVYLADILEAPRDVLALMRALYAPDGDGFAALTGEGIVYGVDVGRPAPDAEPAA